MICLIPARGGSQRIPRKNIKDFHGKPIIAYSIETALKSGLFDHIFCTSDDSEIIKVSRHYGAFPLPRSAEMSQDDVGTQDVARYELKALSGGWVDTYNECLMGVARDIGTEDKVVPIKITEYTCVLYPCSPLLEPQDLRNGYIRLLESGVDYVYSTDAKGVDCGNYYFGKTEAFIEGRPLDRSFLKFYLPKSKVCDINTPEDWTQAEQLFLRRDDGIKAVMD